MNPNNGGCGEMNSRGARRWWALAAITLGVLAVGLDVTVLSVALPTLAVALKASESDLQWFSSGYALTLAAGMLPAGVLGTGSVASGSFSVHWSYSGPDLSHAPSRSTQPSS